MKSASSSSIEESKSVKKRSSKTPAKGAEGKDSDIVQSYEQLPIPDSSLLEVSSGYDSESGVSEGDEDQSREMSSAKETNEGIEFWYKFLRRKIGLDITARQLIKINPELAKINKSELMIRLAYELCLAKNTEYDLENDAAKNEEEHNKHRRFDTSRIFALFKVLNGVIEKPDRGRFTEFVCQKGNVDLLEMICQQENKDRRGKVLVNEQYSWQGEFTGYERLIDLLQYILEQRCSSEIVLCIAKKVYGNAHIFCNGKQYLNSKQIAQIKEIFDYQSSVIEDCLKAAIELSYKDVVQVMLGGDVYHCIRLMKGKKFQEGKEALDMIEETVAEVMSSWVNDERQSCKSKVLGLLKEGIEVDINKMEKKDLINELKSRQVDFSRYDKRKKEGLVEILKKEGGGKVRLRKTVVGGLISTLFFNYQKELTELVKDEKPFELKISPKGKSERKEEINKLNEKIDNTSFVKEKVLKVIQLLNSNSYRKNNWFFREVLAAIVNDEERFNKLKAVCTAICKEPMERLLRGAEVHEDVVDVLKFFGVEISSSQIKTLEIPKSSASIDDHFAKDIQKLAERIKEESKIDKEISKPKKSDRLAFSGLSRNIIIELKKKKRLKEGLTDEEKDNLSNAVSQVMSEIKKGIDILADESTDIKDIFKHFEIINNEIKKEDKIEIVKFVCQKGNVDLLEMICRQENKCGGGGVQANEQYSWQGEFTGYERLIDLLQYILEQRCPSEIVLYIAKKVYGTHHNVLSGREYLENSGIQSMEKRIGQPNSVMEECLKTAIELSYKDVVQVMLGGDVYHCIRLMKGKKFQEGKEALDMIEETVAEVMSSWVNDERQSCKSKVLGLLKEGIEVDINKMEKKDLINELKSRQVDFSRYDKRKKERLVEILKKEGRGKVRLRKTVVGGLISTLFFNYQKELTELVKDEKPFELKIPPMGESQKGKEINELNKKIDSESFVKEKVLEKIKSLNSNSHISNNWFFREVLSAIVNDEERLGKLKAVCTAICKEKVEELLEGAEVHEDVADALKFFGVDIPSSKRDLSTVGPVETMDLNEYTSPSSEQFLTETNKLSGQDIVDIAKYYYRWMEPINGKYLEDTNEEVFFTCTDVSSLEDKLKHYKEIQQKDLIFTSIINTGKEHWVTLVIARSVKDGKFSAYYCDSFGKGLSKKMSDVLKKALEIDANRISSSQIKQQKDEYNCGIFALADAYKITRIIKDKSFTEINVELKGKLDAGQLRKEFAKKVEEMRQSERNSEANSEYESVIMQDSVENVSSRQPSASRDLQETSSTVPAEMAPEVKVLSPVSPGSKVVEEKNKSFMQTSCRQGENSSYNKDENSHLLGGTSRSISGELDMLSGISFQVLDKKRKERKSVASYKTNRQIHAPLPSFQDLSEANRMMYMRKVLDEFVLNYNMLSYRDLYRVDSLQRSPNESMDSSRFEDEDAQELDELFLDSDCINQFNKHESAIGKLVRGDILGAQKLLLELVNNAIEPAYYTLAVVIFKEIARRYDICDGKDIPSEGEDRNNIETAVKLLKRADQMSPANRFLLGMMKRCNIGKCGRFIDESWQDDLVHVVNVARGLGVLKLEPSILKAIDSRSRCGAEEYGLGMKKKQKALERMANHSLYEIAQSMLSEKQFSDDVLNSLFASLSKDNFPEGLYGYGLALIQDKISGDFQENVKKAKGYLDRATSLGHEGAKLLLGVLSLRAKTCSNLTKGEIKRCIHRLEDYINNSDDSYPVNKENVDKVVFRLALEYNKRDSNLVRYEPERAERILRSRGLHKRLEDLRQQSQVVLDDSAISSVSKVGFSPKFSSTERYGSSSGVSSILSGGLSAEQSSSIGSEDENVFDSNKTSTFSGREQERRGRKNADMGESSGWRKV